MTALNPYLSFRRDARQAMEFYRSVFGGELTVSTFGEYQVSDDPAEKDLIMHAQLITGSGPAIMAADTPASMPLASGSNISVSLSGDDEAELTEYWEKLSSNGTVIEPLAKAPWGDSFGMCKDSFGTTWMVNISGAAA